MSAAEVAIRVAGVALVIGDVILMRAIARELTREDGVRTNHGRRLPPRSPSREKRGW